MRPRLSIAFVVVALVLLGAGVLLQSSAPAPELQPAAGARPLVVTTFQAREERERPQVEQAGLLDPRRLVELYAEGAGRILETGAEELDVVAADQLLARIDPVSAEVAVRRTEAGVARAKSDLSLARAKLTRQRELAGSAVASAQALEEAESAEEVAVATLEEEQARLREARDQLARRTIRAAFGGVLRVFSVEVGEYVQVGEKIGELLDVSSVRITVGLSDRNAVAVRVGEEAHVVVEALPGERFTGRVERTGRAADPESRRFPVQVSVDNADGRLLPGMVARVTLRLGDERPRLLVPREAVLDEYERDFAFVLVPDAETGWIARRRDVLVRDVPFEPSRLEVVEGLAPGDEVAVTGVRQLRDGVAVERRAELPSSAAVSSP